MGVSRTKSPRLKQVIRNSRRPPVKENQVIDQKELATDIPALKKQVSDKGEFSILLKLLKLLHEAENFEELNNQSDAGLALYPAQPQLYHYKALALNKLGKYNDAIDVLTIGIDFVVTNNALKISFYERFEEAYIGLKNSEKAAEYNQKAADLRTKAE